MTTQKRAAVTLNKATYDLVESSKMMEVPCETGRNYMTLRPANGSSPHTHGFHSDLKRDSGQIMVWATVFTAHNDLSSAPSGDRNPTPMKACSAWTYPKKARSTPGPHRTAWTENFARYGASSGRYEVKNGSLRPPGGSSRAPATQPTTPPPSTNPR